MSKAQVARCVKCAARAGYHSLALVGLVVVGAVLWFASVSALLT